MVSSPSSSHAPAGASSSSSSSGATGRSSASRDAGASSSSATASNSGNPGAKRQLPEPEVIALNELLDTFPNEMDDAQHEGGGADAQKRRKLRAGAGAEAAASYQRYQPRRESPKTQQNEDDDTESDSERGNSKRNGNNSNNNEDDEDDEGSDDKEPKDKALAVRSSSSGPGSNSGSAAGRHTKLTDLEQHVRSLERDNLHLKQALLLGKNAAGRNAALGGAAAALGNLGSLTSLSSLAGLRGMGALGAPVENRANIQRMLAERTKVVTEMVEQLNAAYLSLGDASRVWHEDCRIGVGVREWDAFGRLQTISLWNMIRSVFTSIVVDIVELRPHLPDGEMILTKWRIQGEIASAQHLERVCASEDCPATMRVALMAIKSSDLTFTVTTYVVFQELRIAEQHHCWDQVGVFKRLFGGEIPPTVQNMLAIDEETAAGRKQPLEV